MIRGTEFTIDEALNDCFRTPLTRNSTSMSR